MVYESDQNGAGYYDDGRFGNNVNPINSLVLGISEHQRLAEINLDTYSPEQGSTGPSSEYSLDEKAPVVAVSSDLRRASIHPLGNLDHPPGVDPKYWNTLDPERIIPQKRNFVLRTEPVYRIEKPSPEKPPVMVQASRSRLPVHRAAQPPAAVMSESMVEEEHPGDQTEMPFLDHLEEFRWALLKSIITMCICVIIGWPLSSAFFNTMVGMAKRAEFPLIFTKLMEPIIIKLQMSIVIGLVISLPFIFYFMWSFIAPGLYKHEKRWVLPLVFAATACFLIGAGLAFFIILPYMLGFIKKFVPTDILMMPTAGNFIDIFIKFSLLFGFLFELPVISFVLARIGILKHTWMSQYRRFAIVFIFIFAAIFTPPDPISIWFMAIPLLLLYEISIWIARFAEKKAVA